MSKYQNNKSRSFLKKVILLMSAFISMIVALCACGTQSLSDDRESIDFEALELTDSWDMQYSRMYTVDEYGDYYLVNFGNDAHLFVMPSKEESCINLPENTVVVNKPVKSAYLVSSAVMDMIDRLDALDAVKLCGTKEKDWHIDGAVRAMQEGSILYAGKYSQPDYELILNSDCDLAIENTMIWHNPEAMEKLTELGIPVMVELSSMEDHPLGRLEWIRLYGLLFDKLDEANAFFDDEVKKAEAYSVIQPAGKDVAFFYITTNGSVVVKKPDDYIPKMIRMAGGEYVPGDDMEYEKNALSTTNMQFEEFYYAAKDADIIIYNSTILNDVECIDDILKKNALISDFNAVRDSRVYLAGADFYQQTTGVCDMIKDLNIIIQGGDESNLTFLRRLY